MKNNEIRTFGIVGGDKRQLFLAKAISDSCYDVLTGGFDRLDGAGAFELCSVKRAITESDAVIFPLPPLRADGTLNAPFSDYHIIFDSDEVESLLKKPVFTGMSSRLFKLYPELKNGKVYDYGARDDFAILNALPTAEGALECAMRKYEGTISGSRCLVTGFGRIGKILSHKLSAMEADITVSARKPCDLAYIAALGYKAVNTESLKTVKNYDIVFNTIPKLIFDRELLMNTATNTLIIDLASLPGGVDFETAEKLKIDAVRALSLPGKCAPKAAGEIIKTTVFDIIKEVYR